MFAVVVNSLKLNIRYAFVSKPKVCWASDEKLNNSKFTGSMNFEFQILLKDDISGSEFSMEFLKPPERKLSCP